MKFKTFLIATLLVLSWVANAKAGIDGGGGNVVRCATNYNYTYELLDYYEAKSLRKINVELPNANSYQEKAILTIDRIASVDAERATRLKAWVLQFVDETLFIEDSNLTIIGDSGHLFLPSHCQLIQVAIQRKPHFPEDYRYHINKNIWNELSDDGKAGLLLHEIIYREFLSRGFKTSNHARYFNSKISDPNIVGIKLQDYQNILYTVELPFQFYFIDSNANRWAYLVGNYGAKDQDICFSSNMRLPRYSDVADNFIELAAAMESQGLFTFEDEINVLLDNMQSSVLLQRNNFIYRSNLYTVGRHQALCISK